jgi:predicted N-acyltransferase
MENLNYVTRVQDDLSGIAPEAWDGLLARQSAPSPFMQHAYLSAMQTSQSAVPETGWTLQVVSLWRDTVTGPTLAAACPLYLKTHSRGEYVFDHAWADAYERHGLNYYPKALVASPFTPVPGSRLPPCWSFAKPTTSPRCTSCLAARKTCKPARRPVCCSAARSNSTGKTRVGETSMTFWPA